MADTRASLDSDDKKHLSLVATILSAAPFNDGHNNTDNLLLDFLITGKAPSVWEKSIIPLKTLLQDKNPVVAKETRFKLVEILAERFDQKNQTHISKFIRSFTMVPTYNGKPSVENDYETSLKLGKIANDWHELTVSDAALYAPMLDKRSDRFIQALQLDNVYVSWMWLSEGEDVDTRSDEVNKANAVQFQYQEEEWKYLCDYIAHLSANHLFIRLADVTADDTWSGAMTVWNNKKYLTRLASSIQSARISSLDIYSASTLNRKQSQAFNALFDKLITAHPFDTVLRTKEGRHWSIKAFSKDPAEHIFVIVGTMADTYSFMRRMKYEPDDAKLMSVHEQYAGYQYFKEHEITIFTHLDPERVSQSDYEDFIKGHQLVIFAGGKSIAKNELVAVTDVANRLRIPTFKFDPNIKMDDAKVFEMVCARAESAEPTYARRDIFACQIYSSNRAFENEKKQNANFFTNRGLTMFGGSGNKKADVELVRLDGLSKNPQPTT